MQSSQTETIEKPAKAAANNEIKFITTSKQTLITAATPLLAIMVSIRNTTHYQMADELRLKLLHIINYFENQVKVAGYAERTILAARYCLCTALDEAILGTTWGSNSIWAQRSLLATIHKETWGGEKFYIIVEKMLQEKDVNIELLELFYLILNLGFEGKYFNDKNKLTAVKNALFLKISSTRAEPQLPFSAYAEANTSPIKSTPGISLWIIIIATTLLSIMISALSKMYLNGLTRATINHLSGITLFLK